MFSAVHAVVVVVVFVHHDCTIYRFFRVSDIIITSFFFSFNDVIIVSRWVTLYQLRLVRFYVIPFFRAHNDPFTSARGKHYIE